jgi:hypothetical protein
LSIAIISGKIAPVKVAKRSRGVSNSWLWKRIERLKGDHEFSKELEGIIALQKDVWQGQDLSHELTGMTCLAVSPGQGFRATLDRAWASKASKTWKAVKEFSRRLQKFADEVAQMNAGDPLFFAHRRNNDLDRHEIERIGWICQELPENMRVYADALEERNAAIEVSTRKRCPPLVDLSLCVEQITGEFNDEKLAGLLNTAALVLNREEEARFSAQNIAQARYRFRRRNRPT